MGAKIRLDLKGQKRGSIFFFFNIYSFLKGRDRARLGEGQRERDTQKQKQASGSEASISTEPDAGLKLTDREIVT